MMDNALLLWAINALLIVLSGVGGWLLRQLWDAVSQLRDDLGDLKLHISENYVSYPRLKDLLTPIAQSLDEIKHTLKEKQDK